MVVSTKGRYALRVMIDLAEHTGQGYTPMKAVAQRQNISLKYIERLLPPLVKNNYITAMHGKGGGYRLTMDPSEYRVGDILRLTEGDLAPVACLRSCNAENCEQTEYCRTRPMWEKLDYMINDFFDGITLEDLVQGRL